MTLEQFAIDVAQEELDAIVVIAENPPDGAADAYVIDNATMLHGWEEEQRMREKDGLKRMPPRTIVFRDVDAIFRTLATTVKAKYSKL